MKKREYLVSIGLAQGTRGRFSKEADAAWNAYIAGNPGGEASSVIGDPDGPIPIPAQEPELPRDGLTLARLPEDRPVVRKENLAYTIDDRGRIIGHDSCGGCRERINRCDCGGPWSPKWIDKSQRPYLLVG